MQNDTFKTVLIGAGGVATQVGRLLQAAGDAVSVIQILGRSRNATLQLAVRLNCPYTLDPQALVTDADLYIIAISDKEIAGILPKLKIAPTAMIVHTAGGVSIDVFKGYFESYGVLYPLQSLRKETTNLPVIPFYLDANNDQGLRQLEAFAKKAGLDYHFAGDQQRLQLHVAAVFCSNFPNYLFAVAAKFCKEHGLDFTTLFPLIEETATRLTREKISPAVLQTGPAIRKDRVTTQKHLSLLQTDPTAQALYRYLSEQIMNSPLFEQ